MLVLDDQLKGSLILIVGEDTAARKIETVFSNAGYMQVRTAAPGAMSRVDIAALDPHLIVVRVTTDDDCPFQLGRIDLIPNGHLDIPILVVAREDGPTLRVRALLGGAMGVYEEPVDAIEFLLLARNLLKAKLRARHVLRGRMLEKAFAQ